MSDMATAAPAAMDESARTDDGSNKGAQGRFLRWGALFLMSFVIFGTYYLYDALSTLRETMEIQLGFTTTDYGLVVAMYSFPNTFLLMAVVGGVVLDRIGIRKTGFIFALFCALGAVLTAYGASPTFLDHGPGYDFLAGILPAPVEGGANWTPQLVMMMAGRLLFGLGAETLIVVQNKVIAKWFRGRELAFAFGVNLAICRLGTALALIGSPLFLEHGSHWTLALWAAAIVMLISFFLFVLYMAVEKGAEKRDPSLRDSAGEGLDDDEKFRLADIGALLKNRSFLWISMLCVTFYSAVFPFQSFCADMLHNKFDLSTKSAGFWTSAIIWGTIVFTPLFGYLVDKKGKRATLMVYGSLMLVAVHLILGLTPLTPIPMMFLLGVSFSLVPAAMWPAVAVIVEEKRLGTAYGLMTSIQNLGLFAFPILAGAITEASNPGVTTEMLEAGTASLDYTWTMVMFAGLGLMGLLFAFLLKRADRGPDSHGVELPSAQTVQA